MIRKLGFFLFFLFSLYSVSFAYDVMEVKNGGSIDGTVMSAAAHSDEMVTISSDVNYCGKSLPAEKISCRNIIAPTQYRL